MQVIHLLVVMKDVRCIFIMTGDNLIERMWSMKKIYLASVVFFCGWLCCANAGIGNEKVYNFLDGDGTQGEVSELILRNQEKILSLVNAGRSGKNEYFIVQYIFGNFTNSENTEVLVFFNQELYRSFNPYFMKRMQLYIFDSQENIVGYYGIDGYTEEELEHQFCLAMYSKKFPNLLYECAELGRRYNSGWICDLNGNGKQELIFYSGMSWNSTIWILEFSEGALRNLLEDKDEHTRVIDADVDEHTIYLERTGFCVTQQKYVRYRAKYIWNSRSGMYEEKIIKIIDSYKPGIGGSA